MILVGNKNDMCTNEEVGEYDGKDLAEKIGAIFLTVSAKKSTGIDDLFLTIGKQLINLHPTMDTNISEVKTPFNNEDNKNDNTQDNYKELEKENKNLKDEINNLNKKNSELQKEINDLKMKNSNLLYKLNYANNNISQNNQNKSVYNINDELIFLMKKLEMKENEIKSLEEGNDLLPIIFIFVEQKIYYSIICKKTDKFCLIENKLYDIYPQYLESENTFYVNGNKINRFKTISDNNIKYSDIVSVVVKDQK